MKIRTGLLVFILTLLVYCRYRISDVPDNFQSEGTITGYDLRMCPCCGGWQIVIDDATYNFDSLPPTSDINLQKETFPLYVKLDWQTAGPTRCPKWINILRIKKE